MGIYVGDSEIKCIYLGDTPLKEVYLGDTKIRPILKNAIVDFLLIGGGGKGGNCSTSGKPAGGGGAGGFVECFGYEITPGNYTVTIGCGGQDCGNPATYGKGCPSCFDTVIAYGGGMGYDRNTCGDATLRNGASGGGGSCGVAGGSALYGSQGCNGGGYSGSYCGAGGGGAGCTPTGTYIMRGGDGKCSSMSGEEQRYSGGGGGGSGNANTTALGGAGGGGNGGACNRTPTSATYYGGGGGGSGRQSPGIGGSGCQGVFILRYPSSCGYNITGGTKYECNGYCIHCFTSSGTLTLS